MPRSSMACLYIYICFFLGGGTLNSATCRDSDRQPGVDVLSGRGNGLGSLLYGPVRFCTSRVWLSLSVCVRARASGSLSVSVSFSLQARDAQWRFACFASARRRPRRVPGGARGVSRSMLMCRQKRPQRREGAHVLGACCARRLLSAQFSLRRAPANTAVPKSHCICLNRAPRRDHGFRQEFVDLGRNRVPLCRTAIEIAADFRKILKLHFPAHNPTKS